MQGIVFCLRANVPHGLQQTPRRGGGEQLERAVARRVGAHRKLPFLNVIFDEVQKFESRLVDACFISRL
ncbi:hypothetical protein SAMN06265338_101882 [Rhodoblastus acidophilus]|uniref:Uncharacterized protein n=1 Tax=Rhodoblastus acidophilus TaxID=1074 RepID=A0A212QMU3_RHOAC|nr:hypothetical protein [Rhodoblastus acidophilus]PPQ38887.1 hypothetical protein CKO16_08055 [Rhodoblastus acidophilus]SNB60674.1 hypothetical protein SAMN06265338_101882 [Rhodoblastus acidophilus]